MTTSPELESDCRSSSLLSLVGDKWTVLVIMALRHSPKRFNVLKRAVSGISQQMLTRTLRALERDGMVTRTVRPTIPPQVEYDLAPLGHSLAGPVIALGKWVESNLEEVESNRVRHDDAMQRL